MQLARAGISPQSLRAIFLTHHHFDHIGGLGDVILSAWNNSGETPPPVFGPKGTERIMSVLLDQVYAADIETRLAEARQSSEQLVDIRSTISVNDVGAGVVCDADTWRVVAEHVDHMHGMGISREDWVCFGYRIRFEDKVVAFSGDTVPCEGVQKVARGADVLVQCCYLATAEMQDPETDLIARHMLACSHQVGKIAADAGVKRLVLTHFREKSEVMMRSLAADVRQDFNGELLLGEDLMVITA
jgi:ribonuclease Z